MPFLQVIVGQRNPAEFGRVVQALKSHRFHYGGSEKQWWRPVDDLHAASLQSELRQQGIRAEIKDLL